MNPISAMQAIVDAAMAAIATCSDTVEYPNIDRQELRKIAIAAINLRDKTKRDLENEECQSNT